MPSQTFSVPGPRVESARWPSAEPARSDDRGAPRQDHKPCAAIEVHELRDAQTIHLQRRGEVLQRHRVADLAERGNDGCLVVW